MDEAGNKDGHDVSFSAFTLDAGARPSLTESTKRVNKRADSATRRRRIRRRPASKYSQQRRRNACKYMQMYDRSCRPYTDVAGIALGASYAINHNTTNSGLFGCQLEHETTLITALFCVLFLIHCEYRPRVYTAVSACCVNFLGHPPADSRKILCFIAELF